MKEAKDLRNHSLQELEGLYEDSCRLLFDLRNKFKVKKEQDRPHEVRHARKDIARILTIMTEKRHQANFSQAKG